MELSEEFLDKIEDKGGGDAAEWREWRISNANLYAIYRGLANEIVRTLGMGQGPKKGASSWKKETLHDEIELLLGLLFGEP